MAGSWDPGYGGLCIVLYQRNWSGTQGAVEALCVCTCVCRRTLTNEFSGEHVSLACAMCPSGIFLLLLCVCDGATSLRLAKAWPELIFFLFWGMAWTDLIRRKPQYLLSWEIRGDWGCEAESQRAPCHPRSGGARSFFPDEPYYNTYLILLLTKNWRS